MNETPSSPSLQILKGAFALGIGLLLLGCSPSMGSNTNPSSGQPASQRPTTQATGTPQSLPITAEFEVSGQTIQIEVARTRQQQSMGLMFRTELADNRGMLFSFNPPRPVQFWMRNTLIPLDMVFLRNGEIQAIAANVPPCTSDPCPTYGPHTTIIDQVIELRGGRAAELGLEVGDQIQLHFLEE